MSSSSTAPSNPSNPDPIPAPPSSTDASSSSSPSRHLPVVIIVIGMAGSGKTSFIQRLYAHLHAKGDAAYCINLDPAVSSVPFPANIDIRDTVNYKEVMKQYNLGPNGGILTSLNLFTTKFDQVLGLVEKRAPNLKYIILDTPGQIEIFTWSASGQIVAEALAASYPTVVAYVVDTPRTTQPSTFMANMLYACSILYKTRLPFLLLFSKTDVVSHDYALDWLQDYESYQRALARDTSYSASLANSMCLVLEEFYRNLRVAGVSAVTGQGVDGFLEEVEEGRKEYESDYRPYLAKLAEERRVREEKRKQDQVSRLMKDLRVSGTASGSSTGAAGKGKSATKPSAPAASRGGRAMVAGGRRQMWAEEDEMDVEEEARWGAGGAVEDDDDEYDD
ncbi:hypothetical protein M427DRAFT_96650 [Gonapodya prolifera JEL478]|uniref:GPN-loop GTPase n=1 Tax=Gonapodya prolifera (strain JEL478) TaxID=1344416 RepID=A0A139ALN6_GONPJ|nr:hypothetical protein M427DRAFT_96650 [Gonapodya prolifera JEL478]|eukprot:KXS17680.1 hypothetical protein M427DRAFT_96650 [Gonapodya prolifera JEL478]